MKPTCSGPLRTHGNNTGHALVAALIVIIVLAAMMGAITVGLLTEGRYAVYEQRRLTAYYIARSGLEAATALLLADAAAYDGLADSWSAGKKVRDPVTLGDGSYSLIGLGHVTGRVLSGLPGIVDEERKLNLNTAGAEALQALHPALTKDIVKAIIARREKLPFADVSELAAIEGLDARALGAASEDTPGGLASLLTVYGEGAINVNTAPSRVLACLGVLEKKQVQAIAEVDPLRGKLVVSSSHFSITSVGRLSEDNTVVRKLRQVVRRDDEGIVILRTEQLQ